MTLTTDLYLLILYFPLYEMLNLDKINELMQNPDALSEPWYGQLMRGPQVLAYIVQVSIHSI